MPTGGDSQGTHGEDTVLLKRLQFNLYHRRLLSIWQADPWPLRLRIYHNCRPSFNPRPSSFDQICKTRLLQPPFRNDQSSPTILPLRFLIHPLHPFFFILWRNLSVNSFLSLNHCFPLTCPFKIRLLRSDKVYTIYHEGKHQCSWKQHRFWDRSR